MFNKLYKWNDHPLKVVIEPQKPTPRVNLYAFEIENEFKNPNKKQPNRFKIKIASICQRNKAPITAPNAIKQNVLILIALPIYFVLSKNPNAKAVIPRQKEIINNFNAIENFKCKHNSKRS